MLWTPRPWQPPMMTHIAQHPRCALLAAMGSGKSGGSLHALEHIDLLDDDPALILGPKRVAIGSNPDSKGVWSDEADKWDSFREEVVPIKGTQTQRFQAMGKRALFYSINYEQLPWLVKHWGRNWPYRTIVADELTRLKGMRLHQGGQRTQALAKVAWLPAVNRFIGLTGTPAPNGLKDIWGWMWYLDRGERLGRTYESFKQRWFQRAWDGYGIEPLPHAQEQIQDRIRDLCLTIDPIDYGLKLDKVIETDVFVDLPDKARDIYREMEKKMFVELEHALGTHEIEAVNAAGRTNKCLQLASGAVIHETQSGEWTEIHTAKIEALESIVAEANGMPILVSYQFVNEFERIKRHFPKALGIDETTEADWNAGRVPMLVCHPASAGHGLNLQWGSNILVDFSSGWNLEHDDQIIERIGPMRQYQAGLNRPVYRYRIMARNTVDEMVRDRRTSKRSVQSILLEAMKRRS
jgi:SNF2 family DNA or RNA helicase